MATLAMFSYYDWDYYVTSNDLGLVLEPIPPVVWLLSAIFHFSAHTLDGIDGKQARRTKSSSPLGKLKYHYDRFRLRFESVSVRHFGSRRAHSCNSRLVGKLSIVTVTIVEVLL